MAYSGNSLEPPVLDFALALALAATALLVLGLDNSLERPALSPAVRIVMLNHWQDSRAGFEEYEPALVVVPPPYTPASSKLGPAEPEPIRRSTPWISESDYPMEALRQGHEGTVRFKLSLAEDIKLAVVGDMHAEQCVITASSGHPELDQKTCELMLQRARFGVPWNIGGRRMERSWDSSARWSLRDGPILEEAASRPPPLGAFTKAVKPATPLESPAAWLAYDGGPKHKGLLRGAKRKYGAGVVRFALAVDHWGEPASCHITGSSGYQGLDATTCELLMSNAIFRPARDSHNEATVDLWEGSVRWEDLGSRAVERGGETPELRRAKRRTMRLAEEVRSRHSQEEQYLEDQD